MRMVRAAWVCPITRPPIRDGWVALDRGRIAALGGPADPWPQGVEAVDDVGAAALLPGLVNAHTHIELSYLAGRVPPATCFTNWVKQLVAIRGGSPERGDDAPVQRAAERAASEARGAGTAAVGDISNSLTSIPAIEAARLCGIVFHEVLGFTVDGAVVAETRARRAAAAGSRRVRVSLAAHAPYSTSPELFRAVRAEVDRSDVPITTVHLGEGHEEVEMLVHGTGEWPRILRLIGAWRDGWREPGVGPVEYLDGLGLLDPRTLVVHGVQFGRDSLGRLADIGCTLVTCPRSNQWVGAGAPPVARFYESGVRVAVGTDSLASVPDLNLFAELAEMRRLAPEVPAGRLLASATIEGARALGLDRELGSLETGRLADIVAVSLPAGVAEVEEYLVSGVRRDQVSWAAEAGAGG